VQCRSRSVDKAIRELLVSNKVSMKRKGGEVEKDGSSRDIYTRARFTNGASGLASESKQCKYVGGRFHSFQVKVPDLENSKPLVGFHANLDFEIQ
jgi:hypothetical protein